MKELTQEEFRDRLQAIGRAKKIFSNLTDGNITNSFIAYQEIFAERERELFITSMSNPGSMSKYERPKCPDCGAGMKFIPVDKNDEGIQTVLTCSNPTCDTRLDSPYSMDEWRGMLKKK
jgi:hypothetical protein